MDWTTIAAIILGIISVFIGAKWQKAKKVLLETAEALTAVSLALKDDKLTKEEIVNIAKEFNDIILAAKDIK